MKINSFTEFDFNFDEDYGRLWINTGSGYACCTITKQEVQTILASFEEGKDLSEQEGS